MYPLLSQVWVWRSSPRHQWWKNGRRAMRQKGTQWRWITSQMLLKPSKRAGMPGWNCSMSSWWDCWKACLRKGEKRSICSRHVCGFLKKLIRFDLRSFPCQFTTYGLPWRFAACSFATAWPRLKKGALRVRQAIWYDTITTSHGQTMCITLIFFPVRSLSFLTEWRYNLFAQCVFDCHTTGSSFASALN